MHTRTMKRINIFPQSYRIVPPLLLTLCLLASCNYGAKPVDPQDQLTDSVKAWHQEAQDQNINVRVAAVQALGNLGAKDPVSLTVLRKATEDKDGYVRQAAVQALASLKDKKPESLTVCARPLKIKTGLSALQQSRPLRSLVTEMQHP